ERAGVERDERTADVTGGRDERADASRQRGGRGEVAALRDVVLAAGLAQSFRGGLFGLLAGGVVGHSGSCAKEQKKHVHVYVDVNVYVNAIVDVHVRDLH